MTLSQSVIAWRNQHNNGRIPLHELTAVPNTFDLDLREPGHFMPEAARSFEAMRKAMFEDIGIALKPSRTYRTFEMQEVKWADFQAGGTLAARPGTSNHGFALAGDMGFGTFTDPRFLWLKRHGAAYGWHQNDAPSEPWHWDYEGDYDRNRFNFLEEEMTPEETRKLEEAYDVVRGVDDYLMGKTPATLNPDVVGVRRRTLKALCDAANKPVATGGDPVPAPDCGLQGHTHESTVGPPVKQP